MQHFLKHRIKSKLDKMFQPKIFFEKKLMEKGLSLRLKGIWRTGQIPIIQMRSGFFSV